MNHEQNLKWKFCVVWYLPRTLGGIGQETAFKHKPDIKLLHKLFRNSHSMSLKWNIVMDIKIWLIWGFNHRYPRTFLTTLVHCSIRMIPTNSSMNHHAIQINNVLILWRSKDKDSIDTTSVEWHLEIPDLPNNTTGHLTQRKIISWVPVGQATGERAPVQTYLNA